MNKSELRKSFKEKRNSLSADYVQSQSQKINDNLIANFASDLIQKKLAFYHAANNEVNPEATIKYFFDKGCEIALPRIADDNKVLSFRKYNLGESLEKNKLFPKLLEPKKTNAEIIPDVVFVPLISFDKNCNRLGMGGGFYDSTINFLRKKSAKIKFIGLAYDFQFCQNLPKDDMDQSLDFIVSQTKVFSSGQ